MRKWNNYKVNHQNKILNKGQDYLSPSDKKMIMETGKLSFYIFDKTM